jgi:hypothetical protein
VPQALAVAVDDQDRAQQPVDLGLDRARERFQDRGHRAAARDHLEDRLFAREELLGPGVHRGGGGLRPAPARPAVSVAVAPMRGGLALGLGGRADSASGRGAFHDDD